MAFVIQHGWRCGPFRVLPSGHRDQAGAAITMTAGSGVRTVDGPNRRAADDALDLFRMDDDGGWQDGAIAG